MTRIILQWMLVFIIGGISLLVSGESTVPITSEEKRANSETPLILSTTGNISSNTSSISVDPKTKTPHEELYNLVSTTSNIELEDASNAPKPLGDSKTQNSTDSEVSSTEIFTTLFSTDPADEKSKFLNSASSTEVLTGKYDGLEEMVPTSNKNLSSDKDGQHAEDASDKSQPSTESEISETSTSIFNNVNEMQSENSSFSNEKKVSHQTNFPMSSEATEEADVASVHGSTSFKTLVEPSTKLGNTDDDSARQSLTKEPGSSLAVSESTTYLETEIVTTVENRDKTSTEDLTTENLLSLHKTTPKSATKKRSLNNTDDFPLHHETTANSETFGPTSLKPELITLLEHVDSSTSESVSKNIMLTNLNMSEVIRPNESNIESVNSSAEPLIVMSVPNISSEFGIIGNAERNREMFDMPHSKPIKISENHSTVVLREQENLGAKEMEREKFQSEASANIPKISDDNSHLNNVDNADNIFPGVTFDPDGMKNDGPQDPDSIVFYVPSTNSDKASTPQNVYSSTAFTENGNSDSEREFEFVTHKDLKEGGNFNIGAGESERMEYMPMEHTNISPEPLHNPPSIETIETSKNSNSSNGFVFWDPSNGGWILPETSTGTQIKRVDTELNNESEEMLQDAPNFPDIIHLHNKSPSSLEIESKEKEEMKTTVGEGTLSANKNLETEVVTELGFMEFSNSFVPHHTDQSVIRPVKIKLTSPDDKSVSTSILPETFSTLTTEQPSGLKLSEPTTGTNTEKIESSSTNSSSPIILPNPAPSVTTELVKNPELSTVVVQPELVPVSLDTNVSEATGTSNSTSVTNSTIEGIAVKTSVSVSLPLSKTRNGSQTTQQPLINEKIVELMKSLNVSSLTINGSTIIISPTISASSAPNPSDTSTDGLTVTSDQTTTESGIKIRKPKIRIPGGLNTPRPYRPFSPNPKRPTTTAGPPVSIFNKQRTRINSITSSTTARPLGNFKFNGNLATVNIQFASDIPGLLPKEFLLSTEPVTTTTPEPTTTEEPISEVPFTDPTHTPTVVNEDDVTLVKVAGYVVIDRGLRWNDLLHNRHSPEYRKSAEAMHLYLERMFRSSPIASRLWKIEIDGFSGNKKTRPVGIDFFLYLIKAGENIPTDHLALVFHEKLSVNNTFGTFRVDPSKTAFEMIKEEPLKAPPPPPEEENVEPPIPQWAIAVIVIGAASLIFIVLFAAVTIYGRHHMRRRYSSKLSEEDMERSSGEWESKMAAAYENMAADTIYDAEDLHSDTYKKNSRIATFHGIPSTLKRCDSWSSNGRTTPPKRKRPPVH